jgi:hypothetical protein
MTGRVVAPAIDGDEDDIGGHDWDISTANNKGVGAVSGRVKLEDEAFEF